MMGLALAALMMSGCSAPAAPLEPEALPVFASDEEAFAAAEATLQLYVTASNSVDLAEPKTSEAMLALTTGAFNASERKALSAMHASGMVKRGAESITLVQAEEIDRVRGHVTLAVCLDVSGVELFDADGLSKVSDSRSKEQTLRVDFQPGQGKHAALMMSHLVGREGAPECER